MLGLLKKQRYRNYHDFDLDLGGGWEASLTYDTDRRNWYGTLFYREHLDGPRADVLTVDSGNPLSILRRMLVERPAFTS